jgi:hypothetical protein
MAGDVESARLLAGLAAAGARAAARAQAQGLDAVADRARALLGSEGVVLEPDGVRLAAPGLRARAFGGRAALPDAELLMIGRAK